MAAKGQHVVPREGGWAVRSSGSARVSGRYATQEEAIAAAVRIAKTKKTEVYIHGRDGLIRSRNSYGEDRFPAKG
ncbi:DUF2188 domain-containing protein [Xanthobacter autotrophicus DSM 597]|uniref:DUF2188 domain-containing protein n=1 Tax=Xanthobacter wiegelii TaxID=3119913 RepID=UPI00372B53A7